MNIFILEDSTERMEWFRSVFSDCNIHHTKIVKVAEDSLRKNHYDLIFLDRDLGDDEACGEELTKVMMEEKLCLDTCIVIHTINPWGKYKMREHLQRYHKNFYEIEFTELVKKSREDFRLSS
tara:strand:+ start:64084 stop:64449 length:366 start_codon:yes stop_codon:yes gene_type:complete